MHRADDFELVVHSEVGYLPAELDFCVLVATVLALEG